MQTCEWDGYHSLTSRIQLWNEWDGYHTLNEANEEVWYFEDENDIWL